MKVVYLVHPLDSVGNFADNVIKLTSIIKKINLTMHDVIPFAPYLVDATILDITKRDEMLRAAENDNEIMKRTCFDEIWIVGEKWHPYFIQLSFSLSAKFNVPVLNMVNKI